MADVQGDGTTNRPPDEAGLADLGVLLVHGIGQSHSSDTLSRFGEPLVGWIVDWVGEFATAKVEVIDAVLGVEAENPDVPAHTRLALSAPSADGSGIQDSQWLIAESWWAQSFLAPSFAEIATWAVKVVPWTAFYHFHRRLHRALARLAGARAQSPRRWLAVARACLSVATEFLAVIAALLIAPVVVLVLMLTLALGMIPIPQLRRLVGAVQRGLASTIGDSYALLGPKIGSAGIYGRVARQLAWLEQRSRRVAVVAHSQGAAIAYRVVATRASEKCGLLVTFGAGIRKLAQIRLLDRSSGGWAWATSLAVIFFVVAALISRQTLGIWQGLLLTLIIPLVWFLGGALVGMVLALARAVRRKLPGTDAQLSTRFQTLLGWFMIITTTAAIAVWFPGESRLLTVWVSLLVCFAWGWVFFANQRAGSDVGNVPFRETAPSGRALPATEPPLPDHVRWLDFYAVSDPVPNGPIFDEQVEDPVTLRSSAHGIESIPTHNRGSLVLDHTSYWQNAEDFVAELADALGALSDLELANVMPLDRERRTIARHRRLWRVRWLRRARWIVFLAAAAAWIRGDMVGWTQWLLGGVTTLATSIPGLGALLEAVLPETPTATTSAQLLVLGAGIAAALGAVSAGWAHWEAKDRQVLMQRRGYPTPADRQHHSLLFHFAWLAVVVTVALLLVDTAWPWWAYLATGVGTFFVAAGFAGGAETFGFPGDTLQVWPALLARHGAWTEAQQKNWRERVYDCLTAWVDPVTGADGERYWRTRVVLIPRDDRPQPTESYRTSDTPYLYDALLAGIREARTVEATTGDGRYLSFRDIYPTDDGAASIATQFWTRIIDGADWSPLQRAEALIARAALAERSGNDAQAVADYTAVLQLDGAPAQEVATAHLFRGRRSEVAGNADAAVADYSAAIDTAGAPADVIADALAARGWTAYLAGANARFVADTEAALKLKPDEPWVGFNLALGRLLDGDTREAHDLFRSHAQGASGEAIAAAIQDLEAAAPGHPGLPGLEANLQFLRSRLAELTKPVADRAS